MKRTDPLIRLIVGNPAKPSAELTLNRETSAALWALSRRRHRPIGRFLNQFFESHLRKIAKK